MKFKGDLTCSLLSSLIQLPRALRKQNRKATVQRVPEYVVPGSKLEAASVHPHAALETQLELEERGCWCWCCCWCGGPPDKDPCDSAWCHDVPWSPCNRRQLQRLDQLA
ncbi:unnamed protein product [Symbiodinium sp. CCMP2592]|nr:unnamed protein product [Symbiodinium sp. CCMP2592]